MPTPKLNYYLWRGIDSKGQKKRGKVVALCQTQVLEYLCEQNIDVRLILKQPLPFNKRIQERFNKQDITRLSRQWSSMIDAGLPITTSLKLIANTSAKAGITALIWQIRQKLEAGLSVTQALKQSSDHFDPIFLAIVNAGEKTGRLAESLERIASHREKLEYIRSKALTAAIYPCLVLGTALLVTILMLTQVIPELEQMFSNHNAPLPWFTQQVIYLSQATQNYGPYIGITITLTIWLILHGYHHSRRCREWLDSVKVHLPYIGNLHNLTCFTQFCRTLATCCDSGLPITPSLHASVQTCESTYYQKMIDVVTEEVNSGQALHIAMRQSGVFPQFMMQMIMLGEESGRLTDMLHRIANEYERELEKTIERMSQAFEPIMIVILGTIVSSLVIAMYLPIFNLVSVMG
ncbi:type II secretion system protein F [Vibrio zhanjiangensis]|uniref:Type II secretion system protein F n=1 Tax=Vibrio zhanjiangensis TaxID=1046128 RepID=A0ABQ6F3R3_9VIBR|nr:type II secretion system F family protein [Vibrio zhanjiangensis]GLT20152.1 type II secretion system protein F [Vibrio zhanjiangensis]